MSEELITLVICLREAQNEFEAKHTHQAMVDRIKYETKIDQWIQKYMAEQVQLELWARNVKSTEEPGAYNVLNNDETEART